MGYGLAPSQQSADTETGATPSLGESFLVQFFTCICILYFEGDSTPLLLTFFFVILNLEHSAVWLLLSIIDSVSVVLMSERRGRNPLFLCPT